MNILVAITSYGRANDRYLEQLITEYRSMDYAVDIAVFSNIPKILPAGVELIVGLPTRDPWSLAFAHKRVFAERADRYDLFIYTEDDILITEDNVKAFLEASRFLPEDEIAGFLRIETGPDGRTYYPDVHGHYHWDAMSVKQRGGGTFAFFTGEHAACYILTRTHLKRAIESGGFLVKPHQGKYDLACTASTDPYTQCGFRKMICVSELASFQVRHLSNRYVGTSFDLEEGDFLKQRDALLEIQEGKRVPWQLLTMDTLAQLIWSKVYYEPARQEIIDLVPYEAKSVLSIGCGWGALEGDLIRRGVRVVGIPLDSVISACAEARGLETICDDVHTAFDRLHAAQFDCIVISDVLQLMDEPLRLLSRYGQLLNPGGCMILSVPNHNYVKVLWRSLLQVPGYARLWNKAETGVYKTTHRVIRRWLMACHLVPDKVIHVVPRSARTTAHLFGGLFAGRLSTKVIVRGRKTKTAATRTKLVSQYSYR